MKKIWTQYLLVFGLGIALFIFLISMAKNPEIEIEGEWSELTWEYEKADKNETIKQDFTSISNYVKDLIGENLVIHKAEKWKFYPNGKLILEGNGYEKEVSWHMKGRGNILEIKYDNQNIEHYNLTELSDDKLVLNFDTDTHTRGIARLTFVKTNPYVKKI
ncbi:hypothetical protein FLCU109888_03040 [Flavobacterium cucumis]|uniref:Lipocalin-like domain-containing protein n=1 Tax=Flavobacterium cucumis TaxID=416016 RepID=A0A1M7ZUV2_9FLAO|nr:hypothetical protein [Flavobacterium cucumis]SHO72570.1 hypothetical protein SAMN05443547_0904 [Flavobacterium cucumis]